MNREFRNLSGCLVKTFFLLIVFTSCKDNESTDLEIDEAINLFPVKIGNSWSYKDHNEDIHLVKTLKTEDIGNKTYYKFEAFPFPFHEFPGVSNFYGENALGWIREDAEGVYLRMVLESDITTTPFEINIFRNEDLGSSWTNEFNIEYQFVGNTMVVPVLYNFHISETSDVLNINGIEYQNTTKVSFSCSLSYYDEPYVKELEGEFVFAEKVGLIQTYFKSTANGTLVERHYSIVDYKLK